MRFLLSPCRNPLRDYIGYLIPSFPTNQQQDSSQRWEEDVLLDKRCSCCRARGGHMGAPKMPAGSISFLPKRSLCGQVWATTWTLGVVWGLLRHIGTESGL